MTPSANHNADAWPVPPARLRHWRRVRRLTLTLLALWSVVTLAVCWFARELNELRIAGFPIGFWMAAQGAICIYVGLIFFYAWVMDRWEAALASTPTSGAGGV